MHKQIFIALSLAAIGLYSIGCASTQTARPLRNANGQQSNRVDPNGPSSVGGSGMDSADVIHVADRMVRDLMANTAIGNPDNPPRVRMDSSLIKNESHQRMNMNLFADRLRSGAQRAALRMRAGISFVDREHMDAQLDEKDLKEHGIVDDGTLGNKKLMGIDYRLQGRIADMASLNEQSGVDRRWFQIVFELKEEGTGLLVWISEPYDIVKEAVDDVIYR